MNVSNRLAVFTLSAALAAAGCDMQAPPHRTGGDDPPAGQGVQVRVDPGAAEVAPGGEVPFTATVTGTAVTTVTWSVVGTSCGAVTATGLYTAPGAAATCQVRATSVADPTRSGTATVTVTAPPPPPPDVAVTVSPATGTVDECRTLTFTANVTGATDRTVRWSVQETGGGTIGATSGVYTAPSNAGTYHVVATSNADPRRTATATVTVTSRIVSVVVAPATLTVAANGTQQFTATVTTTCGAFTSTQSLRADGTLGE